MTLPELYEQQQRETEQFKSLRLQVWDKLQQVHKEIIGAFQNIENVPTDSRNLMSKQIAEYNSEWSLETGQRHQELIAHHKNQRQALTGISAKPEMKETEVQSQSDPMTEKQNDLQKIIKMQQAIRAKQQQRKRGR